ncbi:outer membrane protein [Sphingomonas psychrotolerans]|uniref:Opacity protein n=1 Tax=Sphingomonas psychrotolerans TaxID=1327635 RepID=A0A2K8MGM6_9SPHN|nr:opacity protein [Sphingomonas psychrotolerans]ATY30889.1 opacity protein [Sphingomonas psychrotolerans]
MRILITVAAFAAALPTAAFAQDSVSDANVAAGEAPDGSPGFGIEPYFGIMGGYEQFDDSHPAAGIPAAPGGRDFDGGIVQGVAGVNVPLGPVFVGVEGNATKGLKGAIDWEYGVAGRAGFRIGDSGLIYGKAGYQWVNFDALGDDSRDFHDITAGLGVEVGPKEIGLGGITGNSGIRFRLELNSFGDFNSFQPVAGIIAHF